MGAAELLAAFAAKTLSPVEAVEASLDRIEKLDGELNAFCLVAVDEARAAAKESEKRWHSGEPAGALHGISVSIKDLFDVRGWPTLMGSLAAPDTPAAADAPPVARLREAGAVLIGKTTTPEWGHKGVTESRRHGITRNPWNPDMAAGGSSGGAAVALAAGMGTLALGSDGGGSCRTPASFCGVFGMKPSGRTVPAWPPSAWAHLAMAGPMARTAGDTARMLAVIGQPDRRDPLARPAAPVGAAELETGVGGLRIGISTGLGFGKLKPETAALVEGAAQVFTDAGASVETVDPRLDDPLDLFRTLFFSLISQKVAAVPERLRGDLEKLVLRIAELGENVSGADYVRAAVRALEYAHEVEQVFENCDVLVTAATSVAAFPVGRAWPDQDEDGDWENWTPCLYPFNIGGQPAISVPCGFTAAGLPVGMQIVAPVGRDDLVLRAAAAFEREVGPAATPPL